MLLITSSILPHSLVHVFRNDPIDCDEEIIELIMVSNDQLSNYAKETFEGFEINDIISFDPETYECIFFMRFNRKTQECKIEFNTHRYDNEFSDFEDIMEQYIFLYD